MITYIRYTGYSYSKKENLKHNCLRIPFLILVFKYGTTRNSYSIQSFKSLKQLIIYAAFIYVSNIARSMNVC